MPDQPLALAGDRVDGTGRRRLLGEAVDHRDDPLLVRDGDVRAEELVATQARDGVGELDRRAIPELVGGIDPELIEGRLLHGARKRMGDRVTDQDDALRHARTPSRSAKKLDRRWLPNTAARQSSVAATSPDTATSSPAVVVEAVGDRPLSDVAPWS